MKNDTLYINYKKSNYDERKENNDICSICLDSFINNEEIFKTKCSHVFHIGCLQLWFDKNDTCPLCKSKIDKNEYIFSEKSKHIDIKYNLRNFSDRCVKCKKIIEYNENINILNFKRIIHKNCIFR